MGGSSKCLITKQSRVCLSFVLSAKRQTTLPPKTWIGHLMTRAQSRADRVRLCFPRRVSTSARVKPKRTPQCNLGFQRSMRTLFLICLHHLPEVEMTRGISN